VAEADIFAALGDETRLHLAQRLRDGPASLIRLTEGMGMSRQAVAKHLNVMQAAGLAASERQGRESLWRLRPEALQLARSQLDALSAAWDVRLEALRRHVERDH
jgi:DNA-binding transcriptional ArsR family regulator